MVRDGITTHTMLMSIYTHRFLAEAAPAATVPCASKQSSFERWANDVLSLAGRYAS
jgi:hypothetical protein